MASLRGRPISPEQSLEMAEKLFEVIENCPELHTVWSEFICNERQYDTSSKTPHDHIVLTVAAFLISLKGDKKYKGKSITYILNLLIAYFQDLQGDEERVIRFPGKGSTMHESIKKEAYTYAYCSAQIYPFLEKIRSTVIENPTSFPKAWNYSEKVGMLTCAGFLWAILSPYSSDESRSSIKKHGIAIPDPIIT
jgi:hypothetical protein